MMQVAGFALLGMGVSEMQEEIEKGPRFIERHGRIVEDYDQGEEVLTAVAGIILAASGSRLADKARE